MAKFTKYLFILLSTTYFLVAGTGYNIVKYCCKCCENKPVVQVMKKTDCCDNNQTNQSESSSCMLSVQTMKCFFVRVHTDTPLFEVLNFKSDLTPKSIDLFFSLLAFNLNQNECIVERIFPPPEYNQILSGREILALKAVLII